MHTDNSSYFVGDTLWYKAYVSRADNLQPTHLSKLLYVELLSPDGIVVERQHVVISGSGLTCGQFYLTDSLYSGYYEIRAYTRWQMNFNVTERDYTRDDRLKFYNEQLAKDFFRDFEGLYSRVIPVYNKPKKEGDYADRYMVRRPKQNMLKEKDYLVVTFYPEGGNLIDGVKNRIGFEVKDNNGQGLDISGTLSDGTTISPQHLGRGSFFFTPSDKTLSATFMYKEKKYSFNLPKAMREGFSLIYDTEKRQMTVQSKGIMPAAYSVMCRGQLIDFKRMSAANATISLAELPCPTGINEVIVYDAEAKPLASRLFFVNNHDLGKPITVTLTQNGNAIEKKTSVAPYAKVDVKLEPDAAWNNAEMGSISLAIRDAQTDERGYDDGNIMTDMLLSSELKGFVAYPGYYFAADDVEHRANLDLLMMIQGWRRYKRADMMRYLPERSLTFEGVVGKVPESVSLLEVDEVGGMMASQNVAEQELAKLEELTARVENQPAVDESADETSVQTIDDEPIEYADVSDTKLSYGGIKKTVLVEAELEKDGKSLGAIARTDKRGRFKINLPAFYDQAILFVKAYNINDSAQKCMESRKVDKGWADERSFPDYYVRRDMFFPIYSQPYSWYQVNSPELFFVDEDDDEAITENSKLAGNHVLQTVVVRAKRRGKRAIDFSKPAIVRDAYSLYNDVTDYGLSWGVFNAGRFPMNVATYLFGNMGRRNQFNIRALVEGASFYRNYSPLVTEFDKNMSSSKMFGLLHLNRMKDVRVYTDYELRTDSGDVVASNSADVTLDFVPMPDDGKRYTYRDRRYILDGITYPEAFYSPDYSQAIPEEPKDYRRTLYWNPNVKLDENGQFSTTIFNNCRETRVTVSAAGLDSNGQMYYR